MIAFAAIPVSVRSVNLFADSPGLDLEGLPILKVIP